MTENKERFVLYEYLSFFWKKKRLFVILPIVALLIGALLSLLQSANYTGKAIVYVGDVRGGITDPTYVNSKYGDLVKNNSLEIKVDQKDQITIIVKGDDKGKVQRELDKITGKLEEKLVEKENTVIKLTEDGIKEKENKVELLSDLVAFFTKQIQTGDFDEEEQVRAVEYQYNLTEYSDSIQRMKEDVDYFESPEVLDNEVTSDPKHLKTNMMLGFIAGIFLTIITLIVWKYIVNARRFYKHD